MGWSAGVVRGGWDLGEHRYKPDVKGRGAENSGSEQTGSGWFWPWAGPRLFGLALVVLGALPWLFLYGPVSSLAIQSEWPRVRGEVVASRLGHYSGTENTQSGYNLIVDFSYGVAGASHVNDQRIDMGHISKGEADGRRAGHRPGTVVTVYYDPAKHGKSVIVPGGATRTFYGYTVLGFMLSFVGVMTFLSPSRTGRLFEWMLDRLP